jgi:hypothetical protein
VRDKETRRTAKIMSPDFVWRIRNNKENGENYSSSLYMGPAIIEKMDRACSILEEN